MGKSRSATVVAAYLMQTHNITPSQALSQIRQARSICEPNEGFMNQLDLYHQMQMPHRVDESPIYQRWLFQREVEMSRACGQAPDADKIRFEDEHDRDDKPAEMQLRCHKCRYVWLYMILPRYRLTSLSRRTLATSKYLVRHSTKELKKDHTEETPSASVQCAHYFLDPLAWMRPELEQGKLEGRLECPKCHANVGKYAWQGMQCSCSEWVVPAISLAKGRIDAAKSGAQLTSDIRRPPLSSTAREPKQPASTGRL